MKKSINYKITNAELYVEDGIYMINETSKDGDKVYNLSEILEGLADKTVNITIAETSEVPSQE